MATPTEPIQKFATIAATTAGTPVPLHPGYAYHVTHTEVDGDGADDLNPGFVCASGDGVADFGDDDNKLPIMAGGPPQLLLPDLGTVYLFCATGGPVFSFAAWKMPA